MINLLKKLFGIGSSVDFATLIKDGALIIDVRSPSEYKQDHIKGSKNIPLNELTNHISKIKKDTPIITCCASGMRSASAKGILKSNNFTAVYNGGGWLNLQNKIYKP
ncbi:rhodanese-like domain-containing protein [Flavobacterium sp. 7A]|uniref:rhodanese-like domain-containing protein n=1 Tax=Flavobacterium sp. 7A TaxID=2940571 RepID=UPI002225D70B|nr:rhodanese-like domain-containing protein [Flavobacterium sp. 7A]MCW2121024.1 rhodanese-related sulfurtransferase [Flavobacterium sp. 7A]